MNAFVHFLSVEVLRLLISRGLTGVFGRFLVEFFSKFLTQVSFGVILYRYLDASYGSSVLSLAWMTGQNLVIRYLNTIYVS